MITDAELRPSQNQFLTGAAATTTSTNTVDLLAAANDQGRGYPRRALATVSAAFAGGTSVQALLVESANADLSSSTTLVTGAAVVTADAVAGKVLMDVVIPQTTKRYIGFKYTTVGTMTGATSNGVSAHFLAETNRPNTVPANTGR
jgi:hypothetical protein